MGFLGGLLRCILCCGEEDDEAFLGPHAARNSGNSGYGARYYSSSEDAQIRFPLLPQSSTSRPTQASSSSSLHTIKPLPAAKSGEGYSSSVYPSYYSSPRASPLSALPPSGVTPSPAPSAHNWGKDQTRLNPSQTSLKASPSSSLPSNPPNARVLTLPAGNTRQQGAPVDPRASSPKVFLASSNYSPSASPLQPKVSSPLSSSSQKPEFGRRSPETSTVGQRQASNARVLALLVGNTRQQGAPADPRASSPKVSLPSSNCSPSASPLQPKVSSPFSSSSQKPEFGRRSPETSTVGQRQASNARVLALLVGNTRQQGAPADPRASSPKVSLPSSNCSPSASPLQPKVSSPFSSSSQKPEFGRRSPETSTIRQRKAPGKCNIPERLQELFKNDIMPPNLLTPLSPRNYAEYFSTLLYAEDYEIEKFTEYTLFGVALELRPRADFFKTHNSGVPQIKKNEKDEHPFVAFKVDAFPEKRPYLLSRDFVFVRHAGQENSEAEAHKGEIFRVVKSTVLVEFGRDFHRQHRWTSKYDASFSFNRVCLKRSHAAVSVAPDPLLCKILFPDEHPITDPSWVREPYLSENYGLMRRLVNLEGLVPFLIEGRVADEKSGQLTATGSIIREAIIQIFRACFACKILVCAPRNRTCDSLMRSLLDVIPKTKLFRANAAFREPLLVPDDIMPSCLYEGECFTCPPLDELKEFGVVTSTFMSSFRLHSAGIEASHFTHIFLVDASSAMEPEAIVALANLVGEETAIVISGSVLDAPRMVRSEIGRRKNGLTRSLFRRLMEREPYSRNHPMYVARVSYGQQRKVVA